MVGEKLAEAFVAACVTGMDGSPILAPVAAADRHYVLLHDASPPSPDLLTRIESRLAGNPHYAYARRIGQLGPLRARRCPGLDGGYHRWRPQQGQRFGEIKPPVLLRSAEETARLLSFLRTAPDIAAVPSLERRRTA
jgi:hypothetical protein